MADLVITKVLTNNRYSVTPTVTNTTTAEDALVEDFGEPTVSIGGTIDVVTTATPLTVDTVAGFTVGDTITGDTSGATGTLHSINTSGLILWVKNITNGPFQVEAINSGAANVSNVGTAITTFEVDYSVAPQSAANFTTNAVTRRVISGFPITFTFNGDTNTEAKQNALDLAQQIEVLVTAAWNVLLAKVDDFEGVDTIPL